MKNYFFKINIILFSIFIIGCSGKINKPDITTYYEDGIKELNEGSFLYQKGCYKNAISHFFKAHEIFASYDFVEGIAISINNIGNTYRIKGDLKSSLLFLNYALDIYNELQKPQKAAQVLCNIATIHICKNDLTQAQTILNQAETLDPNNNAINIKKGIILTKQKEFDKAEKILHKALSICKNNIEEQASINFALGRLKQETKDTKQALIFFQNALYADKKNGFHKGIADDLQVIGSIYFNLNQMDKAIIFLQRSIKIYALLKDIENINLITPKLEKASQILGHDITVTSYFVNQWVNEQDISPCEEY